MPKKAIQIHKSKLILNIGLVEELIIWKVDTSLNYPNGIKYRLVLVDPLKKKILLLFDNHAPKGHHWHDRNNLEYVYKFENMEQLLLDFFKMKTSIEDEYENYENKNSK